MLTTRNLTRDVLYIIFPETGLLLVFFLPAFLAANSGLLMNNRAIFQVSDASAACVTRGICQKSQNQMTHFIKAKGNICEFLNQVYCFKIQKYID